MQSNDENPRATGRPSLLTPAQQAEADRHRILSKLENKSAVRPDPAVSSAPRRGKVLLGGGLGLGALLIAAGAWLGSGEGEQAGAERAAMQLAAAAPSTPAAKPDVPDSAPAVIHEEDPLAALQNSAPPAEQQPSLKEMLNARPAPSTKSEGDVLSKALERPEAKPAPKLAKAAPKSRPQPKAEPEPDNDVTLLAALVAHAHVAPEPEAPPKPVKSVKPASTQLKLSQCKKLGKEDARKCQVRVCSGRAKNDAACKAAPVSAKAGTQS